MKSFLDWKRICFLFHMAHMVAVFASFANAAEIVGPERVDPYTLARYSATGGESSSYAWTVHPIGKASVEVIDERLIFVAKPGKYTIQLTEVGPTGDEKKPFFIQQTFRDVTIGTPEPDPPGPGPGPDPGPDPPEPDDGKAPFACDGLHCLVVFESANEQDPRFVNAIHGKKCRDALKELCAKEPGSMGAYRIYDADVEAGGDLQVWQDALKVPRENLPWVVISNGKTGYSGPMPHGEDAFIELLKKYAR